MPLIELTGKQQLEFRRALRATYATEAKFDELLLVLDTSLKDLSAERDPYPDRILAVIKRAQEGNWLGDLISKARQQHPADPALQDIEKQLRTHTPTPVTSPFEVCCLSGGHILVNRTKLRSALRELHKPTGKRILIVKDEAAIAAKAQERIKTGKSHSFQLIAYIEQTLGGFDLFRIDLEALSRAVGPTRLIQPYDLAKSIAGWMGCKHLVPEIPTDGQWARWTLDFCNDFEKAVKKATKTWIVIDSFHVVLLPLETMDLLKELATRINTTLSNLRMVLLGYSDSFHPSVLPTVAEEELRLIGEEELMEFFARAYGEKQIPADEDKVADKVVSVLEGLDPTQPDFVVRVGSLAIAELDNL
jgi:hypothetical protein